MNLSKKKILMNSFFNSQFSYCPLIWMFHSRIMNNKINRLHERYMRLIYGDKTSSFEELLDLTNLFRYTLETCKCWPQKCLKCIEVCLLLLSICSAKCKFCFSRKRKYYLPRSENLGYCTFAAERVN